MDLATIKQGYTSLDTTSQSTIHAPSINQLRKENRDEFNRNHDRIPLNKSIPKDVLNEGMGAAAPAITANDRNRGEIKAN